MFDVGLAETEELLSVKKLGKPLPPVEYETEAEAQAELSKESLVTVTDEPTSTEALG